MRKRLWVAVVVPVGHPEIFGGMWDTDELHRTRIEAVKAVEQRAIAMGLLPVTWSQPEERLLIGRTHAPGEPHDAFVLLVRAACTCPVGCSVTSEASFPHVTATAPPPAAEKLRASSARGLAGLSRLVSALLVVSLL